MKQVVVAVMERADRRILICQRRKDDSSPLKWEFPGGKVRNGEELAVALGRELWEELRVTVTECCELGRVRHTYAATAEPLEIVFYAAAYEEDDICPLVFEQTKWVLPKELGDYDFLAANVPLIAQIATGRIKPGEILSQSGAKRTGGRQV